MVNGDYYSFANSVMLIKNSHGVSLNSFLKNYQLECGPMPNVMVALPNIGGALCSTLQSLADAHY